MYLIKQKRKFLHFIDDHGGPRSQRFEFFPLVSYSNSSLQDGQGFLSFFRKKDVEFTIMACLAKP
jgi:hypothetical protein